LYFFIATISGEIKDCHNSVENLLLDVSVEEKLKIGQYFYKVMKHRGLLFYRPSAASGMRGAVNHVIVQLSAHFGGHRMQRQVKE